MRECFDIAPARFIDDGLYHRHRDLRHFAAEIVHPDFKHADAAFSQFPDLTSSDFWSRRAKARFGHGQFRRPAVNRAETGARAVSNGQPFEVTNGSPAIQLFLEPGLVRSERQDVSNPMFQVIAELTINDLT